MRLQSTLAAATFLAAVVLTAAAKTSGADYNERTVLSNRQKIRTELQTAMADGRLTRIDQYRILLHARDVLPPEDLPGLERTLDRLASAEEPSGPRSKRMFVAQIATGAEAVPPGKQSATPDAKSDAKPDVKYEEPDGKVVSRSPFIEEQSGDICEGDDDEAPCGRTSRWGRLGLLRLRDDTCAEDRLFNLDFASSVEAFKGPMDLEDLNGNFGVGLGLNAGMPLFRRLGVGLQAGTKEILSDFHGTLYTDRGTRSQDFTSFGLFQRIPRGEGSIAWGFTYDWLFDHYYADFTFTQWRIKAAWEMNPWNEVGGWATIRERGDSAELSQGESTLPVQFRPANQGNFYWKHTWCNDVSLTGRMGLAQDPGEMVFGMDGRVPLSPRLALTSSFTYILPGAAGGTVGRDGEFWNVSMGLEFVPGGFRRCLAARFTPLLPVADNGTMAIREVP
jgi:hypothetical protein